MTDVRVLVERLAMDLRPLETGAARAWWEAAVTGDRAAYRRVETLRNRIDRLYADPGVFDALSRARGSSLGDPVLARRVELFYLEALPRQIDSELSRSINRLAAEAERDFATFRPIFRGRRASANDLDRVLREETDEARRREAWEALKSVGPVVAGRLRELVVLRNRAARRVGFPDFYRMRLALQEQDADRLDGLLGVLEERSRPAYRETKRLIDETLSARYGRPAGELEPWISPDESYLVFSAGGRADGKGGLDLYISYRRNGVWSSARPLGHDINSPWFDFNPSVSPDGSTFFFTSARSRFVELPSRPMSYDELTRRLNGPGNGLGDIYSIPIEALEIPR